MTKTKQKIIAVDDNDANLVACKKILKPFYEVYPAPSAAKMFELIEHVIPDLILLDVEMPEMNGYEAAGKLKKSEAFKGIPIIFLSARSDSTSEMFGLNMGAVDYIHKPFVSELLIRRIETHLSLIDSKKKLEERNKSLEEVFEMSHELRTPLYSIIDTLSLAMGTDDPGLIKDYLVKADSASKYLLVQINDILEKKGGTENR